MLTSLLLAAAASAHHPCLGDFVHRGSTGEMSVGARIRSEPDYAEILFSDHGNIQSPSLQWEPRSLTIIDQHDGSSIVLVCDEGAATLVLPSDEYQRARTFRMERTSGSLWQVAEREGWLEPDE
ncbi:MAG: hypothetical protein M3N07_03285 [Pseudomonadota bacterium]|nr:hypothetical protein [Pseudomonadota bacterium]